MNFFKFILLIVVVFNACSKDHDGGRDRDNNGDNNEKKDTISINEVVFTEPRVLKGVNSSTVIMDSLVSYVDHTRKGSTVHINVFLFKYTPLAQSIKNASERGVNFNIIIDSSRNDSRNTNKNTIPFLRTALKGSSNSRVVTTNNQINPKYAINHNKYALFSEVDLPNGVAKNVVFATSHNFDLNQTKMVQDGIIVTNKSLYEAFKRNWEDLASISKNMERYTYTVEDVGGGITAFFFPRIENGQWDGEDTILDQLNKLSEFKKDSIRVLMSSTFKGSRGLKIVKKLTELQNKGANVEVITMEGASDSVKSELNTLDNEGGYVNILDSSIGRVHSKVMLIKGVWENEMQEIILTGSENYGNGALRYNNNWLVRLKNNELFKDYWKYYEELKTTF